MIEVLGSLNLAKMFSVGLFSTSFLVTLNFVCPFYTFSLPRHTQDKVTPMWASVSLEDLQKHCMSILLESSLPIKTRPGYAFSLGTYHHCNDYIMILRHNFLGIFSYYPGDLVGCDRWSASGFKGSIDGYSALPGLKWISSSLMIVNDDIREELDELESELDKAAAAAAAAAAAVATDYLPSSVNTDPDPVGMVRPPRDPSVTLTEKVPPLNVFSSSTNDGSRLLVDRCHQRWDLHIMGHPCFDVPNLALTAGRYIRKEKDGSDDVIDRLIIDYPNRVDMLQNISYFGMRIYSCSVA